MGYSTHIDWIQWTHTYLYIYIQWNTTHIHTGPPFRRRYKGFFYGFYSFRGILAEQMIHCAEFCPYLRVSVWIIVCYVTSIIFLWTRVYRTSWQLTILKTHDIHIHFFLYIWPLLYLIHYRKHPSLKLGAHTSGCSNSSNGTLYIGWITVYRLIENCIMCTSSKSSRYCKTPIIRVLEIFTLENAKITSTRKIGSELHVSERLKFDMKITSTRTAWLDDSVKISRWEL